MPVPGYDPDDVEDMLDSKLDEKEIQSELSDSEWESYQNEEASLIELLDDEQIDRVLNGERA